MADTVPNADANNASNKVDVKETVKGVTKNEKTKTVTPRKDPSKTDASKLKKDSRAADSTPRQDTSKPDTVNKSKKDVVKKDKGEAASSGADNKPKKDETNTDTTKEAGKAKTDSFTKDGVKDGVQSDAKKTDDTTNKKEKIEFPCDACASEGVAIESTNYCNECAENICGDCVKQHRKFPAMKTHTILGKTSRRRSSIVKTEDGDMSSQQKLLECDEHPGKPVEMYCQHHDNVWCPVCMAVQHRSCESVKFITESCKSYTRTKECKDLKVSIRKLKKEVDVMQAKVQNNVESLVKRKDEVWNTIKAFRKRIEAKLDEIEAETLRQLDDVFEKNSKEIESDVEDCKKASTNLEEMETVMEVKPTDTNADFNMFVFAKRAGPRMTHATEVMKNVSNKLGDERIKFFVDTGLEEWLDESYQSFGHFMYKYTTEKLPIAIEKDTEKCVINGMANLSDGRFLLSDSSNKRLKLFEKDFKYIDHMDLPNSPHGLAVLERSSAVVSLPEEKIVQFANFDPRISLINSIDVGEPCRGLSSYEGEIYVICGGLEGECQGHVRIYNMSGEHMRSIERDNLGNVLFTTPVNVCVSSHSGTIYITDRKRGIVTIKQSGELLPVVTDKALVSPWGICEDDKRQLFVTGHNSEDIWQIRNGSPLGVILNAKNDVKEPLCISYVASSSKIVFAMKKCNDITVCTPLTALPQNEQGEVKGHDKHKLRHK